MANYSYSPAVGQNMSGPLAARPSASSVPPGSQYFTTDNNGDYVADLVLGWIVTTPSSGSFAGILSPSGDTTGATDTPAINAAIVSGKRLSAGTFYVNALLLILAGQTLQGQGVGVTFIKVASGTGNFNLVNVINVSGVTISDMTIDLNQSNTTDGGSVGAQIGLRFVANSVAMSQLTVRNMQIINGWHRGLSVLGTSTFPITIDLMNVDIESCAQSNMTGDCGAQIQGTVGGRWWGVTTSNNQGTQGANIGSASGFDIVDWVANSNTGEGLVITTLGGVACSNFQLRGGDFSSNGGAWGLAVSVNCSDFQLVSPRATLNTGGGISIDVTDGSNPHNVVDVNSTITGAKGNGNLSNHGLWINHAKNLTVIGCEFSNNVGATTYGIGCDGQNCKFIGNDCHGNGDYGIGLFAGGGGGQPNMGAHKLAGNNLVGNTAGSVNDVTEIANTYDISQIGHTQVVSPELTPGYYGYAGWTFNPMLCSDIAGVGPALTSGTGFVYRVDILPGTTFTKVKFAIVNAGTLLTAAENIIAIYDAALGTRLGYTGDLSTDFASAAVYSETLTADAGLTVGNCGAVLVYVLVTTTGTNPRFSGPSNNPASILNATPGGTLAKTALRAGSVGAQTGAPTSLTISSISTSTVTAPPFVGIS